MKKICCMLFLLLCMIYSFATADAHLEINCVYRGSSAEQPFTFDLYDQNNQIIAVSSLFSDIAIVQDISENNSFLRDFRLLLNIQPDTFNAFDMITDTLITDWLNAQEGTTVAGVFSGSLFKHASSVTSYKFKLSDFVSFLYKQIDQQLPASAKPDKFNIILQILLSAAGQIQQFSSESDPAVLVRDYDNGRYRICQIMKNDDVLMTLSVIRSEHEKELLWAYKEAGKYCYRHYHLTENRQGISVDSSVLTTDQSAYPEDDSPLYSESFILQTSNEAESFFEYSFAPEGTEEPLVISGEIIVQENGSAEATISAAIGEGSSGLHLSVHLNSLINPVSFSGKRFRHLETQNENEEIRLAFYSGTMMLASWVYPDLSPDYQALLRRLFLP